MPITRINQAPYEYWKQTGYSSDDVNALCAEANDQWMAARIIFTGSGIDITITNKTWERQEGHYPTIAKYFQEVADHPLLRNRTGSLIVWLEDGMWDNQRNYSIGAPVLAFGRHIRDTRTFLMPDPAFIGSQGYKEDFEKMHETEKHLTWHKKVPTIFWRGAASGLGIESVEWVITPRGRLVLQANKIDDPNILDAKITRMGHLEKAQQEIMIAADVVAEPVDFLEFLNYRYLVDADGYCCAWMSLLLKLASKSITLKIQSEYEQWYHWDLIPWKHYVPLRLDVSDVEGAYHWLKENDEAARKINANANQFVADLTYTKTVNEVAELCAAILDCQREKAVEKTTVSVDSQKSTHAS